MKKPDYFERAIRDFVLREIPAANKLDQLGPTDSLFELGLIDSQALAETVVFCEETFGIEIADEELIPENFDTIRSIARLVARSKRASA